MKYDVLNEFRERLEQEQSIAKLTKRQYYNFVRKVVEDMDFNSASELNPTQVTDSIRKLKTKSDVSAAINGFKYFSKYYPEFSLPLEAYTISSTKRNVRKRTWKPVHKDTVVRKINGIKEDRLRLAYRAMLHTGMRRSEISNIRKQDVKIYPDRIEFHLSDTKKSNKKKTNDIEIVSTDNEYILSELPELLEKKKDGDPVFGNYEKLKKKAEALGFECHDLRRIYARNVYNGLMESGCSSYDALDKTREAMRHESCRTTKKYLRRVIL